MVGEERKRQTLSKNARLDILLLTGKKKKKRRKKSDDKVFRLVVYVSRELLSDTGEL